MKKLFLLGLATVILCACGIGIELGGNKAPISNDGVMSVNMLNDDYTPDNTEPTTRGLYTALSLSINGGNGKVWATAKNDFTLFPSTVIVIVRIRNCALGLIIQEIRI